LIPPSCLSPTLLTILPLAFASLIRKSEDMSEAKNKAQLWLQSPIDSLSKKEIERLLLPENEKELIEAFYKDLEFGTGGLRGIMGVGSNRMNMYTVGMATQGFAQYLLRQFPQETISVVVGHDSRHNSKEFAQRVADVFTANGIQVYLFRSLRPTPEVSFAIRHLSCHGGVMVTASHNPKEYNGYKAYWKDGAQLMTPHDKGVIQEVGKITSLGDVKTSANPSLIHLLGPELDEEFLAQSKSLLFQPNGPKSLKIVFSGLHGTGTILIPSYLRSLGYENTFEVAEQSTPNGDFPTVVYPNPEEAEAMQLSLKLAERTQADIAIATDPDADRVGIAVPNKNGAFVLLNGNQTGALVMDYLLSKWKETGKLTGKEYLVKTIVTTELIAEIARHYQVHYHDTLTGFKYIASLIGHLGKSVTYIGGCEESYGFMIGDFVRDKDAVTATAILAEMGEWLKSKGMTYMDYLQSLYVRHGVYKERLISITKQGKEGAEAIQGMMEKWRVNPLLTVDSEGVILVKDYLKGVQREVSTQTTVPLDFPTSNVLQFITREGTVISARPSGTEPKIKFYISVNRPLAHLSELDPLEATLEEKLDRIEAQLMQY
jgi:phosphoglucomutase